MTFSLDYTFVAGGISIGFAMWAAAVGIGKVWQLFTWAISP